MSKLLLSLPAPTAAPVVLLPPPPAVPLRPGVVATMTAPAGMWSRAAAVDVSFELPSDPSSPYQDVDVAHEHSDLQQVTGTFIHSAAHDVPPATAAAAAAPSADKAQALSWATPRGQQLHQSASSEPPLDSDSVAAGLSLNEPDLIGSQYKLTPRHAANGPLRRDDTLPEPARPLAEVTTAVKAATEVAQRGSTCRRLSPFKQLDPVTWGSSPGAALEPPSPTFSAMERAASAAAMVAARLFDAEVLPIP